MQVKTPTLSDGGPLAPASEAADPRPSRWWKRSEALVQPEGLLQRGGFQQQPGAHGALGRHPSRGVVRESRRAPDCGRGPVAVRGLVRGLVAAYCSWLVSARRRELVPRGLVAVRTFVWGSLRRFVALGGLLVSPVYFGRRHFTKLPSAPYCRQRPVAVGVLLQSGAHCGQPGGLLRGAIADRLLCGRGQHRMV